MLFHINNPGPDSEALIHSKLWLWALSVSSDNEPESPHVGCWVQEISVNKTHFPEFSDWSMWGTSS